MSQTMMPPGPPMGGAPPPGAPGPQGVPPGAQPNPAFAAWMQQAQQVQAIQAENAKRTQAFEAAVAVIREDGIHGFRLEIEADSTIAPDEQAEKQARVEFLQQMVPMLQQVVPIAQGNPPLASLAKELTLFAARGFRVARPLEEAFEQAFDAIGKMPPAEGKGAKGAPPPDPQLEAAKVGAEVKGDQLKAETERMAIGQKAAQAQGQLAIANAKLQSENQRTQATVAMDAAQLQQRERFQQQRQTEQMARAIRGGIE